MLKKLRVLKYLPTTNLAIFEAKCLKNLISIRMRAIVLFVQYLPTVLQVQFLDFQSFFLGIFVWISVPMFLSIGFFTKITRMFKISLKYVKMHQRALLISFNQHFIQKVLLALHNYFDLKAEAIRHKSSMGKLPAKKISAIENNLTR